MGDELKIIFGVLDVPYSQPPAPAAKKRRKSAPPPKVANGTQTTGDVAEWLENKYDVMSYFVQAHGDDIARSLENAVTGVIDNILMGAPQGGDPFAGATSDIEHMFRQFLDNKELDGQSGIPTKASLDGKSSRFKKQRGPARPSFIDTGLYQSSFKCIVEP